MRLRVQDPAEGLDPQAQLEKTALPGANTAPSSCASAIAFVLVALTVAGIWTDRFWLVVRAALLGLPASGLDTITPDFVLRAGFYNRS